MDHPSSIRAGRTAAMVMLLADDQLARTPAGKRLVSMLHLESGLELAQIARRDSPAAANRMRLRKACINHWMDEFALTKNPIANNIVIAGAGLAPLALDWCSTHTESTATELDYENMDAKHHLITQCADASITDRLRSITCDLRNIETTESALVANAWRADQPALWIIEGLTYYISHEQLVALIRLAIHGHQDNRVILEFSGSRETLNASARQEIEIYHRRIAQQLGGHDLTVTDIDAVVAQSHARIDRIMHPAEIEEKLGFDRYFTGPSDSAMRVALLAPMIA